MSTWLYWHLYHPLLRLCVRLFHHLPTQRKIMFIHNYGLGYGDSPKAMAEEIARRHLGWEMVWGVSDMSLQFPKGVRKVRLSRIRSVYDLATARVIVTTMKGRCHLRKKRSQFFLYVPHGQIGAKYVERQAGDTLGQGYIEGSKWHSRQTDLTLSSSRLFTDEVLEWYWYNGPMLESGLPRNDILFHYDAHDVERIRCKARVKPGTRVVLYAPTFRNEKSNDPYAIDVPGLLATLREKTGEEWTFLFRAHPCFIWYGKPAFDYGERVIDVTAYDDIQELLIASDVLITDYSSTMFDFALLRRPIFLFTKDIAAYQRMRGLKDWFFRVPYPFCHDNAELMAAVSDFDAAAYRKRCEKFDAFYGSREDGHATERVIDLIAERMDGTTR